MRPRSTRSRAASVAVASSQYGGFIGARILGASPKTSGTKASPGPGERRASAAVKRRSQGRGGGGGGVGNFSPLFFFWGAKFSGVGGVVGLFGRFFPPPLSGRPRPLKG